ncbi:hypothetical protein F5Y00DRAFT_264567 [Daldinia vernicosa]|uniref:uncharacterized protein n=1 Tax=Daldinia vernicosa TaxID=114800 RepID=UPI0020082C91|nr:uncharacterized protein F5Y00DRAFT_264567 [Daldinia vernicosa]KAI0846371.1 hypothetical protein F5Y00DRAFT_264567 [Daldinia vernicosa]
MCQQYLLKFKACGHFERDEERIYCDLYDCSFPDSCLQRFEADIIREFTPGDSQCYRCLYREYLDAQWDRIVSTNMDDTRLAFIMARECLFSFNFVTMEHLQQVQHLLTHTYISQGIVIDVRLVLTMMGYKNAELETKVNVDDQDTCTGELSPIPTLEDYMLQFAPTPIADPELLAANVPENAVPTPAQDPEANQYSYETPLNYPPTPMPTPWSMGMPEM